MDSSQQARIEELFEYAKVHAKNLSCAKTPGDSGFSMAHFLLTITAAVENIRTVHGAMPGGPPGKLQTPTYKKNDGPTEKRLEPVFWAWEARNTVAHRCIQYIDPLADSSGVLGGAALNEVSLNGQKPTLLAVTSQRGKTIPAPEPYQYDPAGLAHFVLNFWMSAFQFIQDHPDQEEYTYQELWNHHQSSLRGT